MKRWKGKSSQTFSFHFITSKCLPAGRGMFQFTRNFTSKPSKLIKINTCQSVHERSGTLRSFTEQHRVNSFSNQHFNSFSSDLCKFLAHQNRFPASERKPFHSFLTSSIGELLDLCASSLTCKLPDAESKTSHTFAG